MIKRLTFGQFMDKNSFIHSLDARLKLVYVILLSILVFLIQNLKEIVILSMFILTIILISNFHFNDVFAVLEKPAYIGDFGNLEIFNAGFNFTDIHFYNKNFRYGNCN